jgi:hypothetical protein
VHGVVAHAGVVVGDEVDDLVALPPELVGVEQVRGALWRRQSSRFHRDDNPTVLWGAIIADVAVRRRRHYKRGGEVEKMQYRWLMKI